MLLPHEMYEMHKIYMYEMLEIYYIYSCFKEDLNIERLIPDSASDQLISMEENYSMESVFLFSTDILFRVHRKILVNFFRGIFLKCFGTRYHARNSAGALHTGERTLQ